jgi:hypothetical protein
MPEPFFGSFHISVLVFETTDHTSVNYKFKSLLQKGEQFVFSSFINFFMVIGFGNEQIIGNFSRPNKMYFKFLITNQWTKAIKSCLESMKFQLNGTI